MKKIGLKIIGILIISIIVLQSTTVMAVSSEQVQLKNEQDKIKNDKKQAEAELEEVQIQKSETVKQVEELSNQIADYQSQIDELDDKITILNSKISEAEANLKKTQEDYTKQQKLLEARLVATYEAGETSYLDFLLSSDSIIDLISNYYLVAEVANNDTELLEKIEKQKQEIEQSKKTLETSKKELDSSKASKQGISVQLQAAKNEKNGQVAKLSQDEKQIQQHIDELRQASAQIEKELQAAQKRYEAQIKALEKKNNSSSSSAGSSSSSGSSQASGSGTLRPPVNGGPITATMQYSDGSYHGALDYGVPVGTPVYAAADGVVIKTANLTTSYGTYVVIQHAGGLQTWYAHGTSGSIIVSPGQTVSRGQQIMKSGSTGNSTGPHLHFEVRVAPYNYNTCRVDPRKYF